jgi:phosphodiesterase/alkaline phosphatase D-like protein
MSDQFADDGAPLWADLLRQKPDLILFAGDNVYADGRFLPADPERLWRRYAETRERLPFFQSLELVPVLATWDDHDYGVNDGDFTYPHKAAAKEIFDAFFPQAPGSRSVERGPGVSTRLSVFGQRFFLMDGRTFRNQRDRTGVVTHWGEEQNQWLRNEIRRGTGPIWLVNGSQFFGGYHRYESFEREHPADLSRWLKELGRLPWPTIFVSGDRHLSEILNVQRSEMPYKTFELTSSGIHSSVSKSPDSPTTPRMGRTAGPFLEMNYMIIDTAFRATSRPILKLDVSVVGLGHKVGFTQRLDIQL